MAQKMGSIYLPAVGVTEPQDSAVDPSHQVPRLLPFLWHGFWRGLVIGICLGYHAVRLAVRYAHHRLTGLRISRRVLFGEWMARSFESLGAAFIKLGQVLSSRPDLLSRPVIEPLRKLQDRIAPAPGRRIVERIETVFGRPIDELFIEFDPEPIASASIAQVHIARLADGRRVAVKVRRPGVGRRVRQDLSLMRAMAYHVGRLPPLRLLPFAEMVEEIAVAIESQLDFVLEARNNRRFRDHFYGIDRIHFPYLIEELCGEAVLTMELVENLEKVDSNTVEVPSRERAAVAGLRALYKMIFLDGFIHADLHPGNVFLRADGEMVLLDVGLVAEMSAADRRHFVDFFLGMVTNRGEECARVVEETAFALSPAFDHEAFVQDMRSLISRHATLEAAEFEVTSFVFELFNIQRKHGIRGSTAFTMTLLSLVVYEGIVKQLHPRLDFQREARGYLIAAKYRRETVVG